MMLEIIMPHYNEPWEIVRPFFDVLRSQKAVDFSQIRVHIVHDGGSGFDDNLFSDMPFDVLQSYCKHKGVSAARNFGIDNANAKWITFCDCDDLFSSVYSLKFIMDTLSTDDYDLLWNGFYMETKGKNGIAITDKPEFNLVWIHNKYYRLDFLKEKGLRFEESLIFSEDSAFNAVLNIEIDQKRIGHIKSPFPLYIWSYREGSATLNPDNLLQHIEGQFDRNLYVLNEYRKRNYIDSDAMVGRTLTDCYTQFTRKQQPEGMDQYKERVKQFYQKEKQVFIKLHPAILARVLAASEKESKGCNYLNDDRPSFMEWIISLERGDTDAD